MDTVEVKTSELTGRALDWAVAVCEGAKDLVYDGVACWHFKFPACWHFKFPAGVEKVLSDGWAPSMNWHPSTNWSHAGPIIEREGISVIKCFGDLGEPDSYWVATAEQNHWVLGYGPYHTEDAERSLCIYRSEVCIGPTPLIAAMRCHVLKKLGPFVEIPRGLV